jgi:NAD(P)-dependent dehydrogenase (short-subunit alcohol dehydrogenase family)
MTPSNNIVITGSTRGIGYGLADSFLTLGNTVTVSSRSAKATAGAVEKLSAKHDPQRVFGVVCDVSVPEQVQALWNESKTKFDQIDIWVNNAGYSGEEGKVWQRPVEEIKSVITTNVLGTTYGTQIAVNGMLEQGKGAIYNMEGMGSDGRKHAGLTMYGTSKYAVHYFTQSMALELKGSPIIIGGLRPGMVITDMIIDRFHDRPDDLERAKRIFNIIADSIENVTPWLAEQILVNQKSGVILAYTSMWKLLWRFISSPFNRRDLFNRPNEE